MPPGSQRRDSGGCSSLHRLPSSCPTASCSLAEYGCWCSRQRGNTKLSGVRRRRCVHRGDHRTMLPKDYMLYVLEPASQKCKKYQQSSYGCDCIYSTASTAAAYNKRGTRTAECSRGCTAVGCLFACNSWHATAGFCRMISRRCLSICTYLDLLPKNVCSCRL